MRDRFSFGALIFGPIWLLAQGAWIPAVGVFVLAVLILALTHAPASASLILGLTVLLGFSGRDLVRWSIARRGYFECAVVTGRDEDDARTRLFAARPDLVERSMVAETAP